MATVFVVEDEPSIAEAVVFALQAEGHHARHCATGQACIDALAGMPAAAAPAAILLDIGLPDGSGFDVFRRIRALCSAPVIFLTARGTEIDRVAGLEMGADDYVVKPFSVRELMARVRMVIRRHEATAGGRAGSRAGGGAITAVDAGAAVAAAPGIANRAFVHDEARREFRFRGKPLVLTLHEYRLLDVLLRHPGRVFSRGQLLEQAWEAPDHRLERTVDSHVKSLRAKLREIDADSDPIRTHRGMGYSLEP